MTNEPSISSSRDRNACEQSGRHHSSTIQQSALVLHTDSLCRLCARLRVKKRYRQRGGALVYQSDWRVNKQLGIAVTHRPVHPPWQPLPSLQTPLVAWTGCCAHSALSRQAR